MQPGGSAEARQPVADAREELDALSQPTQQQQHRLHGQGEHDVRGEIQPGGDNQRKVGFAGEQHAKRDASADLRDEYQEDAQRPGWP